MLKIVFFKIEMVVWALMRDLTIGGNRMENKMKEKFEVMVL